MTLIWIFLGLVAWTLGFLFVMVLMRMAGDEDRAALQQEKLLEPVSDVVIIAWRDLDAAGTWVARPQEWRDAA